MADRPDAYTVNAADEPNPKLLELSELLVGTWRVDGPDISGQAEYQSKNGGRLLVAYVDSRVGDSRMRVIQHITHNEDRGTLVARYVDTMGEEATYTWALEDREIRVSLGDQDSHTYFQATLNEDNAHSHLRLSEACRRSSFTDIADERAAFSSGLWLHAEPSLHVVGLVSGSLGQDSVC